MKKKVTIVIFLLMLLSVLSGCSTSASANGNKNTVNIERLACIEIYSVNNQTLLTTIDDKETLETFHENASFDEQWGDMDDNYLEQQAEIQKKLKNYEPQYLFISYQTPAAIHNDGTLEKVLEITTFKDTNIVKVTISPDTVKNFSIPSEYLTFYFETSDEVMAYLRSLV